MERIFFISDTHFFHKNIIEYESRPFNSIDEMDNKIKEVWNDVVRHNDRIYILGDFRFGGTTEKTVELLRSLKGKKHLILGNHDVVNEEIKKEFVWIKDYYKLKFNKKTYILFHYPIQTWDKQHHGSYHLYGHIHSNIGEHKMQFDIANSLNVGWDIHHKPIEINEVIDQIRGNRKFLNQIKTF